MKIKLLPTVYSNIAGNRREFTMILLADFNYQIRRLLAYQVGLAMCEFDL
ncbi:MULTISPECIES: hypothetical protein [Streptococcus]|nr:MULTISPECIES: hypothetical protein [Streptococcus]